MTVILVTTVASVTEMMIRREVEPVHNFPKYLRLFLHSQQPNAIFGDSIVANGFTGVSGFVNLGMGGDNYQGMERKVRLYYQDRPVGKVILQAGPHHLSAQYIRYRDNGQEFENWVNNPGGSAIRLFDPIYRYEIKSYWSTWLSGKELKPVEEFAADGGRLNGSRYVDYPAFLRDSAVGQIAKLTEPLPDPDHSPVIVAMERLVADLKHKGGEVCLVTHPPSKDVVRASARHPLFAQAQSAFQALAQRQMVRYINFYGQDMDDVWFADPTHLNSLGAEMLGRQIVEKCFDN